MWEDKVLKVAFSIHSNPGIYALLLGSGTSREAGIPTGWEIVGDLIKKLAFVQTKESLSDPYKWYEEKFGEKPDYSKILEKLASTPIERQSLLRRYFEPTEEEKEQRIKIPTDTHRSIAKLVKYGYVKVIVTTNFDRLLEKALGEKGITPVVISTDDELEGAIPYVHSNCTLIKVNGDYLDTRLRNTMGELETYSEKLTSLLEEIFERFGLIVCGWSAKWDIALRDTILRIKNRRFPMYWLSKEEVTEEAKRVISHRQADVINIESADKFFVELLEKIESLREFESPHPLSYKEAAITVKRYLSDEKKNRIKLYELIDEETEKVWKILASEYFNIQKLKLERSLIQKRIHEYEELVKPLMNMLMPIAYFSKEEDNMRLISRAIERIAQPHQRAGVVALIQFQHYPALLLLYAAGLVSLANENWKVLKAALLEPQYQADNEKQPILEYIEPYYILRRLGFNNNAKNRILSENDYLFFLLSDFVNEYIPDKNKYEEIFDIFEFLMAVTYVYQVVFVYGSEEDKKTFKESEYLPTKLIVGRFARKYFSWHPSRDFEKSPIARFINEGIKQGNEWGLLKEGFFGGFIETFKLCCKKYINTLRKVRIS